MVATCFENLSQLNVGIRKTKNTKRKGIDIDGFRKALENILSAANCFNKIYATNKILRYVYLFIKEIRI